MQKLIIVTVIGAFSCLTTFGAIDLKESKFTQVVNDVEIISTSDNSKHAASVDGLFKMPDVLRTGPGSRAELVAADNTITRVGANTIFSFDAANRSIHLEQGSLLFNSPKGKGGGSIHTAAATAAVLGTTIIVVTTPSGGFKVLTLEGTAEVKFLSGLHRKIQAGQLIFVLPGGLPGPILSFRLDQQVANSRLVNGFTKTLPSLPKVNAQIDKQVKQIASGKATDTGMYAGSEASSTGVQVISAIAEINGSMNPEAGIGGGGPSTNTTPPPPQFNFPGLTFNGSGFVQPDGFVFTSPTGMPIVNATTPALATVGSANDVAISASTLDLNHVFTSPVSIQVPDQNFNQFRSFTGFAARNITITSSSVDLSPFEGLTRFVFLATETMNIMSSLDTGANNADGFEGEVDFAGATLNIAPGVVFTSQAPENDFDTINALTLDNVTFQTAGELELSSDTSISLTDSPITSGFVSMESSGTLTLAGQTPATGQITGASGIELDGEAGITVGVNLSAADGEITLNGGFGPIAVGPGVQFSAAGKISLSSEGPVNINNAKLLGNGVDIESFSSGVTLSAATISGNQGNVSISSSGSAPLTVNNGTQITGQSISLESFGALNIDSSIIGNSDSPAGSANLTSSTSITLNQTPIFADNVNISSDGQISLTQTPNNPGTIQTFESASFDSFGGMTIGVNVFSDPMTGSITFDNDIGELHLQTGVLVSGNSVSIEADNGDLLIDPGVIIVGSGGISLTADNNLTLGGSLSSDPNGGSIAIESSSGDIGLSPGSSVSAGRVGIVADNGAILVDGNSVVTGNSSVILHANTSLSVGGNISAAISGGGVALTTDNGSISVNPGVQITGDAISLNSASTLQTGSSTIIQGNSQVNLNSTGGANISGTVAADPTVGFVNINNTSGQLIVNNGGNQNTKFVASVITFNSPDGILINTPGQVVAHTVNISATGSQASTLAQLQNADLSGVGALNMNARTIALMNVTLPNSGNSTFFTDTGLVAAGADTGRQIIAGELNFISGNMYKQQLITDQTIAGTDPGFLSLKR